MRKGTSESYRILGDKCLKSYVDLSGGETELLTNTKRLPLDQK